jgi:hypothetical protein
MYGVSLNGKIMEVVAICSNSVKRSSCQCQKCSVSLNKGGVLRESPGGWENEREEEQNELHGVTIVRKTRPGQKQKGDAKARRIVDFDFLRNLLHYLYKEHLRQ